MEEGKNKKQIKKKEPKPRADKYEEKVSFDGTFDDLLNLTVKTKKDTLDKK